MEEVSKIVFETTGVNFSKNGSRGLTVQIASLLTKQKVPYWRVQALPSFGQLQIFGSEELPAEVVAQIRSMILDLFPGSELE
jgi:hypothetical protein